MTQLTEYQIEKRDRLESRANRLEEETDKLREQIEALLQGDAIREFHALQRLYVEYDKACELLTRADEELDAFHQSY